VSGFLNATMKSSIDVADVASVALPSAARIAGPPPSAPTWMAGKLTWAGGGDPPACSGSKSEGLGEVWPEPHTSDSSIPLNVRIATRGHRTGTMARRSRLPRLDAATRRDKRARSASGS
jgi:hypothetical protein